MTNQGEPGLCEETGPRQAAHQRKHRRLHITEDFTSDDERWGQRVCAAVVGAVRVEELEALAHERLAPPKRPKEYFTVDTLPRTTTGKVRRLELPRLLGLDPEDPEDPADPADPAAPAQDV